MKTFTLDTNCMIDVDDRREGAPHVLALLAAHRSGTADVALVASSASENQKGNSFLESFTAFETRRNALGFAGLPLLPSIARLDVSFFGNAVWGSQKTVAREHSIYRVLSPNSEPEWGDYASARGLDKNDRQSPDYRRWRNKMLDAQAYWAHENANRQVFVTSDKRFRQLNRHPEFPDADVRTPIEAANYL